MRTKETLTFLKRRGDKGVSTAELANKFGFERVGSASKLISQLRKDGHNIQHDPEKGVYILIKDISIKEFVEEIAEDIIEKNSKTPKENSTTSDEALYFRISTKKEKILECLLRSGPNGATPIDLSKVSGVTIKNICFHIHALRKDGYKIHLDGGRYIIRSSRNHPSYNKGMKSLQVPEFPVEVASLLGDKRILMIEKIREEDLPTYIGLLKKIIYYTRCAIAMHDTTLFLENLKIGGLE